MKKAAILQRTIVTFHDNGEAITKQKKFVVKHKRQ